MTQHDRVAQPPRDDAPPLPGNCNVAATDPLTGLPNRAAFVRHLQQVLDLARSQPERRFAVVLLDFDRFKLINHGLGHAAGDQLLHAIAQRLRHNLRRSDTASFAMDGSLPTAPSDHHCLLPARTGGDEFVVLLDHLRAPADAATVAQRLQRELARPYAIAGRELYASATAAIVPGLPSYTDAEHLLRDADNALHHAKRRGGPECVVFHESMRTKALERLDLEADLRQALALQQFELHYQPILHLSSGHVAGFEALARWRHPTRGMVSPDQFITLSEELGLIVPLGRWVLEQACRTMASWQKRHHCPGQLTPPRIAVNVSKRQLAAGDFADTVAAVLEQTNLPARHLELELTESLIMAHVDEFMPTLDKLRALGVALSMDDFGTGHSSLSMLHRFPIDVLKIDRQFLRNLQPGKAYGAILQAIIVLAHTLDMEVVAEGIENPGQLAQLQALACDRGQGYLFAKPLPADLAETFLHTHAQRSAIA